MAKETSVISSETTPLRFSNGNGMGAYYFFDSNPEAKLLRHKLNQIDTKALFGLEMDQAEQFVQILFPEREMGPGGQIKKDPFVIEAERNQMTLLGAIREAAVIQESLKSGCLASSPIVSIEGIAAWISAVAPVVKIRKSCSPEEREALARDAADQAEALATELVEHAKSLLADEEEVLKHLAKCLREKGIDAHGHIRMRQKK